MRPAEVLEELRRSEALLEGHFLLSSGNHGDRYFQCALALQHPTLAERLARALVLQTGGPFDCAIGPALGAVTWAYEVARALGGRALFAEREEGRMRLRRGFRIRPGERILVVEDVLTTGGSAREVVELVRSLGGRPLAVGAIVNRSGGNPFEDLGLPARALVETSVPIWKPEECPLCRKGIPAVKPGSRPPAAQPAR